MNVGGSTVVDNTEDMSLSVILDPYFGGIAIAESIPDDFIQSLDGLGEIVAITLESVGLGFSLGFNSNVFSQIGVLGNHMFIISLKIGSRT
ncbi:MAG: hypothetical protein IJ419_13590 [Agathobacter sp.]|nr:hypothetical protein [Agathobacter sp.]